VRNTGVRWDTGAKLRHARVTPAGDGLALAARIAGLLLSLTFCSAALATELQVRVTQADGKPLRGAVVAVHALGATAAAAAPITAIMDQVDLAFAPDLLVIPVGSTVSFPNTDKVSHEVYSFSSAHHFKLGLYRGKAPPPELFDKVGVLTLCCNIHDAMLAYILVTDGAYYGTTGADGSWSQPDVARGKYRIEVWSPRLQEPDQMLQREISVAPGEHVITELRAAKALRPAPLQKRPHSWDAY
jgi:plastocyanin